MTDLKLILKAKGLRFIWGDMKWQFAVIGQGCLPYIKPLHASFNVYYFNTKALLSEVNIFWFHSMPVWGFCFIFVFSTSTSNKPKCNASYMYLKRVKYLTAMVWYAIKTKYNHTIIESNWTFTKGPWSSIVLWGNIWYSKMATHYFTTEVSYSLKKLCNFFDFKIFNKWLTAKFGTSGMMNPQHKLLGISFNLI